MLKNIKEVFKPGSKFIIFFLALFTINLAFGLYKGVLDNYLAEIVEMSEFDRGVSEFFRELPGLFLVLLLAVLYMLSAETIFKLGVIVMMAGLVMHAVVPANRVLVTLAICVYSMGEHMQFGMANSIALEYSQPGRGGMALGFKQSVSQMGTLIGYIVIMIAFLLVQGSMSSYRVVFAAAAVITALAALASSRLDSNSVPDRSKSRFYFRKKFKKFYFLEVFYGARKQVFLTFGPYVLILFYGADTSTISLLFAVSAICCFFASPVVGRIIDKVGYKAVMVADTIILVVICFFYGFAHHIFPMQTAFIVCCVNYVLDSVISLASMASNVYVQDISDSPEEMRATISTGISVNHLITIFIALFGGWVWKTLGVETLFSLSAVLGLCNSAYAASIKTKKKGSAQGAQ